MNSQIVQVAPGDSNPKNDGINMDIVDKSCETGEIGGTRSLRSSLPSTATSHDQLDIESRFGKDGG